MRRFISSFFGCSSSGAVGIEVTTESTKIKRIKNNMAVRKKMKDKELAAQLVNMQVQYDISKLETAVATKDICNDLVPQIKNNMALVMNLKDKELAAQLVNMQVQYDISKIESTVTTKRILNELVLEQYTASMVAQQESEEKFMAQEAIFKRKLNNQVLASERSKNEAEQTILKMGHLIRHNSIAEDLNRLNQEDRHTEEERAVFNVYQCLLADQKRDADVKIQNAEKIGEENLNKLTEEYEKKFKSAITDFEIRLKEQKLSVLYETERLNGIERHFFDASFLAANQAERCGDRDECLQLDGTVKSTSTTSTSSTPTPRYVDRDGRVRSTSTPFLEEYYINQHHDLVGLWDKI
mmetsp:Transcript_12876/g.12509  ORF Transcript_12876/g.12509 Transcript_12876/m.12509 type:complete len:353 (-) Transcript_12876:641-1699(-)